MRTCTNRDLKQVQQVKVSIRAKIDKLMTISIPVPNGARFGFKGGLPTSTVMLVYNGVRTVDIG